MNHYLSLLLGIGLLFLAACRAAASSPTPVSSGGGNADVMYVKAVRAADDTWTFHVTVSHPDTG
jgi:hypothetical protein